MVIGLEMPADLMAGVASRAGPRIPRHSCQAGAWRSRPRARRHVGRVTHNLLTRAQGHVGRRTLVGVTYGARAVIGRRCRGVARAGGAG
jgi:hypothetical protein